MMSPADLLDEMERKPDAGFMIGEFAAWADSAMTDAQFRRSVADVIATYDDAIESL